MCPCQHTFACEGIVAGCFIWFKFKLIHIVGFVFVFLFGTFSVRVRVACLVKKTISCQLCFFVHTVFGVTTMSARELSSDLVFPRNHASARRRGSAATLSTAGCQVGFPDRLRFLKYGDFNMHLLALADYHAMLCEWNTLARCRCAPVPRRLLTGWTQRRARGLPPPGGSSRRGGAPRSRRPAATTSCRRRPPGL